MTPVNERYSNFKSTVADLARALTLVLNDDPDKDMDAIRKLLDDAKTLILETVIAEEQEAKVAAALQAELELRRQQKERTMADLEYYNAQLKQRMFMETYSPSAIQTYLSSGTGVKYESD